MYVVYTFVKTGNKLLVLEGVRCRVIRVADVDFGRVRSFIHCDNCVLINFNFIISNEALSLPQNISIPRSMMKVSIPHQSHSSSFY